MAYDPTQSYHAVFEATRALRLLLQSQLAKTGGGTVTLLPPGDVLPEVSGVNLYLYHVTESPAFRNRPWPGDRQTAPADRPALGLQLSYLLTPLGTRPTDQSEGDDAHTMLGIAMRTLHEHPVLNDVHLPEFDADLVLADFLSSSYEKLKVSLLTVSLDELSKIWATINQPYRLSVAYDLSIVEVSPLVPSPAGGGIVLTSNIAVLQLAPPQLLNLNPDHGPLAEVGASGIVPGTVAIAGSGLGRPDVHDLPTAQVGGRPVAIAPMPPPAAVTVTIVLPADLAGGPDVAITVSLGGLVSNPLTFTVTPWLSRISPVRTSLDPAHIPDELTLTVTGQGFSPAGMAQVRFDSPTASVAVDAAGSDTQITAAIPTMLANGSYQVRVLLPGLGNAVSNTATLVVIPQLDPAIAVQQVTLPPPASTPVHRLTMTGARLSGTSVRVIIDGVDHPLLPSGIQPGTLVLTLGRLLAPGEHTVAVNVDGSVSRTLPLSIP